MATTSLQPVPCPKCGKPPETGKVGSYWRTKCPTQHLLSAVVGHTMGTKKEAIEQWNIAYKTPDNNAS